MLEFKYPLLQFEEELDMFFISNNATSESAWVPTCDDPAPREVQLEMTLILRVVQTRVDELKQITKRK